MLRSVANRAACLALAALAPLAATAASNQALEACTRLTEDSARLACFDREVAVLMRHEHGAAATAPVPKDAVPAATAQPPQQLTDEQKMGLTPERIEELERPPSAPPPPSSMTVAIKGISVDGNHHQLFTLENGQIWRQVELDSHFSVKPGDSITISRGVMGSYFMSLGKHRNTRVSRIH